MTRSVEDTIFELLDAKGAGKTVGPDEVAKAVDPEGWRRVLPQVRSTAVGLARQGRLVITRKGKPTDPETFKGVYRLRAPGATEQEPGEAEESL
ncbi:DUF3253 domain-containing protein [Caulobacter sp. 17J65-9]|uniref:DUF3253 domain-containing protein n=1 Tax=Caulobacter sp. 17J65-9 TaxID=2709382 RepID=UPI0013CBC11A|nr:DUF3253 domain-containing protein [Caulobacter sp. 17J65-9]NEX93341.1 DUF3253 domain-containing protein [Caulobacter sp. 17J65-9]